MNFKNEYGESPLHFTVLIARKNIKILNQLLKHYKVNVDQITSHSPKHEVHMRTPLMLLAEVCDFSAVQAILTNSRPRQDVLNEKGETALDMAISAGRGLECDKTVKIMKEYG